MSKRLTRRICLARAALIKHLMAGYALSSSWPNYVAGVPKNLGRREKAKAAVAADERVWLQRGTSLMELSLDNFYEGAYSAHHYDNGRST